METPSPVKRKATIDLTRSDSEDEAPKRRRRVIEIIESDDDDEAAPAPASTMPWEMPEWKTYCAKERNTFSVFSYLNADLKKGHGVVVCTVTGRHRVQIVYFFRMQIGSRTPSAIGLGSGGPLRRMRRRLGLSRELWIKNFGGS